MKAKLSVVLISIAAIIIASSVAFSDNSRGIPEADLKHIFEPFFYSKTGEGGTGIGLSVTYALVQEIKGTISVQSQPGKGTRFNIRIPLDADQDKDPGP